MNVALQPATQRFIDDQIKAGKFATPEAVIEAAIAELREADQLPDEVVDAINEAEAQAGRGEGVSLESFRAEFAKRFNGR